MKNFFIVFSLVVFVVLGIFFLILLIASDAKNNVKDEQVITITLPDATLFPNGTCLVITGVANTFIGVIANGDQVFEILPDETAAMWTPSEGSKIYGWWMAKGKTKDVTLYRVKECKAL